MPPMRARRIIALLLAVSLAAACSGDDDTNAAGSTTTAPGSSETGQPADPAVDGCDDLDPTACLLPFPNDAFTVAADTPTGRRLALPLDGMPTNEEGTPIAVDDMNRGDGFSPGSAVLVHVPGLDVEKTGIAPSTDIGRSLDDDAPVVLLDTETGERVPYWAELDARATDEATRLLIVRPAVGLAEGHPIAVGLRDLRGSGGDPVDPAPAWASVGDGSLEPPSRLAHLRQVEATLDDAVGADEDWWLAWDFTVASEPSLSGRLRHIRDAAYEALGDGAPAFTVGEVTDQDGVRRITGTYDVPLFLDSTEPGGRFVLDGEGLPEQGTGTYPARFVCVAPVDPGEPALPIVYGHGLLGSAEEVEGLAAVAGAGMAACATDWIGMSRADLPVVATTLQDLSGFSTQPDRLQQAHVNMSFLGRLLNHPDGFARDRAFQDAEGAAVFDIGSTQFVGNSQGGILGGAASAVSTEWERVVLGVPGMNYSLLLTRSIDWDRFAEIYEAAYTDEVERVLGLSVIQLLWDRGENQAYARHLTADPYDGIEAKRVLLIEAFGDHQVANVSTELLARTIGARVHRPVLGPGRSDDKAPAWDIDELSYDEPFDAALLVWDYGNPPPPAVNVPPREPEHGEDPHGAGTREPRLLAQAFGFLRTGELEDVCGGAPCTSDANG